MDDSFDDFAVMTEEDYANSATYFVPDRHCVEGTTNCVEASLPRNLTIGPSKTLTDVSIYGEILN